MSKAKRPKSNRHATNTHGSTAVRALEGTFWFLNLCGDLLIALAVILVMEQARVRDASPTVPAFDPSEIQTEDETALKEGPSAARPMISTDTDMDKKAKKKIDVLNQRLQKLRQQLAGAKKQMDEPEEVERLETEIEQAEADIKKLKES